MASHVSVFTYNKDDVFYGTGGRVSVRKMYVNIKHHTRYQFAVSACFFFVISKLPQPSSPVLRIATGNLNRGIDMTNMIRSSLMTLHRTGAILAQELHAVPNTENLLVSF